MKSLIPKPSTGELVDPDPRRFVSVRIRQLLANGESPLEFLLKQMQDPNNSTQFRAYCAVQCAPYIHPKATPDTDDNQDPHERFLTHVEGLRERLLVRLVKEIPNETPQPNEVNEKPIADSRQARPKAPQPNEPSKVKRSPDTDTNTDADTIDVEFE